METSRDAGTPQESPIPDPTRTQQRALGDSETLTAGFELDNLTDDCKAPPKLPTAPAGYDLYRYLGGGGMGDVYLAREHAAERTVAMKFLRAAASPSSRDRFLTEIRALARLDHPNIVRVITVDLERRDPHFTMEYAAAGTLSDRIKAEGPYAPKDAAELMVRIARAVQAAHSAEIVHRDLKPSNIVIAADGSPKISDFGLAKRLDFDEGLTYSSHPLGTPSFMPPEQISKANGPVGPPADIYGLGATLYYMLTGKPPFEGTTHDEILRSVRFTPPPRPRSVRPELPLGLEAIVLKCLEKTQADRYASAEDLAQDLERYLAGDVPTAPPLTLRRRTGQWVRRNRIPVAASLLVAIGALMLRPSPPAIQPDPEKVLENELAERRRVELVPAKGFPQWHAWRVGAATLTDSITNDGTCSFQAQDISMLDLMPGVKLKRYRFSAEIQHVKGDVNAKTVAGPDRVGIYFGSAAQANAEARSLTQFTVTFKDHRSRPPGDTRVYRAEFHSRLVLQQGQLPNHHTGAGGESVPFKPEERWPGAWRRIAVEVTPDSVRIVWNPDANDPNSPDTPFFPSGSLPTAQMRALYQSLQAPMNRVLKQPLPVPEWDPGSAIGIYAEQSTVAFRNVIVEELPSP